jgi:hypothetical protein
MGTGPQGGAWARADDETMADDEIVDDETMADDDTMTDDETMAEDEMTTGGSGQIVQASGA